MTFLTSSLSAATVLAWLLPASGFSPAQPVLSASATYQALSDHQHLQLASDPWRVLPAAITSARRTPGVLAPVERVGAANLAARIEPDQGSFANAIQRFPFVEGSLYQVYTKPGQVTDIALQTGEKLVGLASALVV